MKAYRRLRHWFITKYLPAYVSVADREYIQALRSEVDSLTRELAKERAYSAGLEYSCRRGVIVNLKD